MSSSAFMVIIITDHLAIYRKLFYSIGMNSQGDLVRKAAHDLKSLLTSIQAYNQLIQKRLISANDNRSLTYSLKMDEQIKKLTEGIQNFTKK